MKDIRKSVLNYIKKKHPSFQELDDALSIADLSLTISSLESEGLIIKQKANYFLCEELGLIPATISQIKAKYVIASVNDDSDDDLHLEFENCQNALMGDRVLLSSKKLYGYTYTTVKKILKRNTTYLTGKIYLGKNENGLIPDSGYLPHLKFVFKSLGNFNVKKNQIVESQIVGYKNNIVYLKLIKVLGSSKDVGMDVARIILANNAPLYFPSAVLEEVKKIPSSVSDEEIKGRRDFRSHLICTIDGDDAKDFDDAVEVIKDNDIYHVGVHIADVEHYLKEGSAMDKEALNRSTSLYVQDRVVPMLPFELSNGICSLNPHEDRLTTSVTFDIDSNGKYSNIIISKGVIQSKYRLTYNYVNDFLSSKRIHDNDLSDIEKMLLDLKDCAAIIHQERMKRGSLEIETNELKFVIDDKGEPLKVTKRKTGQGEALIEDLMIAANEIVASTIEDKNLAMVYRIHGHPKAKKLESFKRISLSRHYPFDYDILTCTPEQVSEYLSSINNENDKKILSSLLLRCLAKAKYSIKNEGHFGLASDSYTHFTSPIRRYPDVMVHRLINYYLLEGNSSNQLLADKLATNCMICSQHEKRSLTIERKVEDLLSAKYMKQFIGEIYEATVVSMVNSGLFVELENGIEGMLTFSLMDGDYYVFDESTYTVYGQYRGKIYHLGDKITVKLIDVEIEKCTIDFALAPKKKSKSCL